MYINTCTLITITIHYIYKIESTLTVENLTRILKDVQDPEHVALWLAVTSVQLNFIKVTYKNEFQCNRGFWEYFLNHHPAPSWKVVAVALWRTVEYETLEMVQKLYLTSKFTSNMVCILIVMRSLAFKCYNSRA